MPCRGARYSKELPDFSLLKLFVPQVARKSRAEERGIAEDCLILKI